MRNMSDVAGDLAKGFEGFGEKLFTAFSMGADAVAEFSQNTFDISQRQETLNQETDLANKLQAEGVDQTDRFIQLKQQQMDLDFESTQMLKMYILSDCIICPYLNN